MERGSAAAHGGGGESDRNRSAHAASDRRREGSRRDVAPAVASESRICGHAGHALGGQDHRATAAEHAARGRRASPQHQPLHARGDPLIRDAKPRTIAAMSTADSMTVSRRELIAGAGALALAPSSLLHAASAQAFVPKPLSLWYREPAQEWVQALPVGNGRIGARVFGGIALERFQLNEDSFFSGGPYNPLNPEAKAALPEVRRLILEGKFAEAQALADERVMSRPLKQMSYQPIGDVLVNMFGLENVADYVRELDLETAVARTQFTSERTRYVREVFASAPDQLIVLRLGADRPGRIHAALSLTSPQAATVHTEGDDVLVMSGIGPSEHGIEGRVRFEVRVKIAQHGGERSVGEAGINISGADELIAYIAI